MKLQIFHETTYSYEKAMRRSIQMLRMSPPKTARQHIGHWQLNLPVKATPWVDAYGNQCHCLVIDQPVQSIVLKAQGWIELLHTDQGEPEGPVPPAVFLRMTPLTQPDAAIKAFIEPFRSIVKSKPYLGLHDVMMALLSQMPYEKGHTQVGFTASQSFAVGKGVCQDHTHVFLACVRHLGLPARYVSGYLNSKDQGHVASHAWAEVWIGGRWVGFDVSNSVGADQGHIRLAHGLDYDDASPVRGVRMGGGNETLDSFAKVESVNFTQ